MSKQTKIIAIIGAVLALAAGVWSLTSKPKAEAVQERGYHPPQ